jgi:hypothetical protein
MSITVIYHGIPYVSDCTVHMSTEKYVYIEVYATIYFLHSFQGTVLTLTLY